MHICDCEESKTFGVKALVKETLAIPGWLHESNRMVQCAHCQKILKYYGTVARTDPRTGARVYWTV